MTAQPSLADSLASLPVKRPGPTCSVRRALEALAETDPGGTAALVAAIDDKTLAASGLADVLTRHRIHVSAYSIRRHRHRSTGSGCRCPR